MLSVTNKPIRLSVVILNVVAQVFIYPGSKIERSSLSAISIQVTYLRARPELYVAGLPENIKIGFKWLILKHTNLLQHATCKKRVLVQNKLNQLLEIILYNT
jgi:hypothetical protein